MSPDPITLGPGEFQLSQNLRIDNGLPIVRDGIDRIVNLDDAAFSSRTMYGYWEGYLGGSYRRIGAISIASGTAIRIYDLLTGAEITAASGQFGNTRFTDSNLVQFALISDQLNNTTKLLATNGVDAPRVIYNTGTTNWVCVRHYDVAAPEGNRAATVVMYGGGYPGTYIAVNSASNTTYSDSGGGVTGADDSARYHPANSTNGNAAQFSFTTGTAAADYAQVRGTSGAQSLAQSRQVWVGIESDRFDFIDTWKVSLLNNGSDEVVLWDPSNADDYSRPIPVTIDATNKVVWCFGLSSYLNVSKDQLRFTYTKAYSPTVAGSFWVFMIAFGGSEPGGTLYGCTHWNPYSQAESPGVVYTNYSTPTIGSMGGPAINGLAMPNVPEVLYNVTLPAVPLTSTDVNLGYSSHRFYSRMVGQDDFYLVATFAYASYSGSWSISGWPGTTKALQAGTSPTSPYYTTQTIITMPDAFHKCVPTASTAPAYASGRTFVSASSDSFSRYDTLWVSGFQYPYRFRKSPRLSSGQPVEESPFTVNMPGESAKRAITTAAGGLVGASVYILTDSSVYGTSGTKMSQLAQIRRVSPYGLTHEFAVAEHDGALAWASTTGHILYSRGGETMELSFRAMEDQLAPVTISATEYPAVTSMAFKNGRLYVARRTTSAYQTQADRILVYDFRYRAWVSDDVLPTETPCFMLSRGEGGVKELVLNIVGRYGQKIKVYEYDSYGLVGDEQDAGVQDIAWALKTRDRILGPDAVRYTIQRVGVFATADASTIAVERSFRPDGITATSTVDIASAAVEACGIDAAPFTETPTNSALLGAANAVKLSGSHPARFQIFHAFAELEERGTAFKTEQ